MRSRAARARPETAVERLLRYAWDALALAVRDADHAGRLYHRGRAEGLLLAAVVVAPVGRTIPSASQMEPAVAVVEAVREGFAGRGGRA